MDRQCGNCAFFENEDGYYGFCHRYPPQYDQGELARTQVDWWCGEFSMSTVYSEKEKLHGQTKDQ